MASLLPERAISFSPSLAATLGLEEAVMLQGLQEISFHASTQLRDSGLQWQHAEQGRMRALFPFWTDQQVQGIVASLVDKGVLMLNSAPYTEVKHLYFALNDGEMRERRADQEPAAAQHAIGPSSESEISATQTTQTTQQTARAEPAGKALGKQAIARNWQPDADTLRQLEQLSVDSRFTQQQVPEFVSYWSHRGETAYAWGSKFIKHVVHEWRRYEAGNARSEPMNKTWRPSEDAMEILLRIDINAQFIDDAIPEFVLYWRERGDGISTWNTKFIAHVKKQWARFHAALENDTEPRPLPANWQPSQDVYEILGMANIDHQFARQQLAEFSLFWNDNRQLHSSWNTKFLQHVKYRWARQHHFEGGSSAGGLHAQQQATDRQRAGQSPAGTTFDRLTDRSWASSI